MALGCLPTAAVAEMISDAQVPQTSASPAETADVIASAFQPSTTPLPSQQLTANTLATFGAVPTPFSTVADDGLYSVTIHYLDESNTELTAPTRRVFSVHESWLITSPTIAGFSLMDSRQATMTGTTTGQDHWLEYQVHYTKATASYRIHLYEATQRRYRILRG